MLSIDGSLPVFYGFEPSTLILSAQPDATAIFVSNYAEKAYGEKAMSMEASEYILTNRAASELVSVIQYNSIRTLLFRTVLPYATRKRKDSARTYEPRVCETELVSSSRSAWTCRLRLSISLAR